MLEQDTAKIPVNPPPGVAPFEFTFASDMTTYFGTGAKGSCIGGGGSGAFRLAAEWQLVLNVNGCKLQDLPNFVTGDSLTYMIGPRWTPATSSRWSPHAQVLVGGTKLTQEQLFPDERAAVAAEIAPEKLGNPQHKLYTKDWETSGFAVSVGTGVGLQAQQCPGLAGSQSRLFALLEQRVERRQLLQWLAVLGRPGPAHGDVVNALVDPLPLTHIPAAATFRVHVRKPHCYLHH